MMLLKYIKPYSVFFNEFGLYQLINRSSLSIPEKFQNWVYEEIIPSVHEHILKIKEEEIERYKSEIKKS